MSSAMADAVKEKAMALLPRSTKLGSNCKHASSNTSQVSRTAFCIAQITDTSEVQIVHRNVER